MTRTLARLATLALLVASPLHVAAAASDTGGERPADPRREARRLALERDPLTSREKSLIERPDRNRPEHPLAFPVFGRPLTIGGRYSLVTRYEDERLQDFDFFDPDNRDVDGDGNTTEIEDAARGQVPDDDQLRVNQSLQFDLFYPFTEHSSVYFEGVIFWRNLVWAENAPANDEWLFERAESWLYLGNLFDSPFSLQAGRQRFFDEREWWWDDDLDAVRLRADFQSFHAEIAVAEQLLPIELGEFSIDPEDRDVLQLLGAATWQWSEKHRLGLFALHRRDHSSRQPLIVGEPDPDLPCVPEDEFPPGLPEEAKDFFRSGCAPPPPTVGFEDESDADLTWFGLSASGAFRLGPPGKLRYWLDAAGVFGRETYTDYSGPSGSRSVGVVDRHRVSGAGLDFGLTWETPLPARPSLTLGYAFGSGKSGMREERDRGFRQTGLQDNNDKFRGVASFRYYGELLDPELANLHVMTAGLGFRFLRRSSVDFVYHLYRQAHAAPFLRDANVRRDPDGGHTAIGQEWDVIVGIEEWRRFELKLVGAIFRAGKAFAPDSGKLSYLTSLRLRLNF